MSLHLDASPAVIALLSELCHAAQAETDAINARIAWRASDINETAKAMLKTQSETLSFRREVLEQGFINVMGFADGTWGREATWIIDDRYRVTAYHDDDMPITCWSMSIFDQGEQRYILG